MKRTASMLVTLAGLAAVSIPMAAVDVRTQDKPTVQLPKPGVPQIMTIEGSFVRAAYNNEGYVILGYRTANMSVGDEWMLLEVGMTVREGKPNYTLTRDKLSLETADGKTVPLPSQSEYQAVNLRALEQRSTVSRDSINYFPPMASQACRIGFFAEQSSRAMSYAARLYL